MASPIEINKLRPGSVSYMACINKAVQNKKISKTIGNQLLEADKIGATEDMIANMATNLSLQRHDRIVDTVRLANAWRYVENYEGSKSTAIMSLMVREMGVKGNPVNIESLGKVLMANNSAGFADALSRFRTRLGGLSQDSEALDDFVRALWGNEVKDGEIEGFAGEWLELVDSIRKQFNDAGGSISKMEDWLLPQKHDTGAVSAVTMEEWMDYVLPKLDRAKMLDDRGEPLKQKPLEEVLESVYESIKTGGLSSIADFSNPNVGKKLSRKHSNRRILHFETADNWLDYQNRFGRGDVLTVLTDYMSMMSNDTAVISVFGTNPQRTFDALLATTKKKYGDDFGNTNTAMLNAVFKEVTGRLNASSIPTWADWMNSARHLIVAAKLGKAMLVSFSDLGTAGTTAAYNNLPVMKVYKRWIGLLDPTNEADKINAGRMGLIFDTWLGRFSGANRYADVYGIGKAAKVSEAVMRFSGLEPWTEAGRKAFGMEFAAMLGDNFDVAFKDLDPALLTTLDRYGINEVDWDKFRATEKQVFPDGSAFADLTKDAGHKFHGMIITETDYAIPMPDARVRAITSAGLQRGTVGGEIMRSASMVKSFQITMITKHLMRGATQASLTNKVAYLGSLGAAMTTMGFMGLQVKDIADGKQPRYLGAEDWEKQSQLFKESIINGGFLGVLAESSTALEQRYGSDLLDMLAGPAPQLADDLIRVFPGIPYRMLGELIQTGELEESLYRKDAGQVITTIKNWSPNLWYMNLVKQSMFNQFTIMADPSKERSYLRSMQYRNKDYGVDYFWAPTDALPEEMPTLIE